MVNGWSDEDHAHSQGPYNRRRHRISKSSFVSAIRKTLLKYSSTSRTHPPASTPSSTPVPHGPTHDDDGRPAATPLNDKLNQNDGPSIPITKDRPDQTSPAKEENNPTWTNPDYKPNPEPTVLSPREIQSLFSGAPVFAASGKKASGELRPRVIFPFDENAEELRGLSDCPPIEHAAFSLCTSRPHRTLNGYENTTDHGLVNEEPSMLCFQGIEPGTCGWEYFLKYPVGDSENRDDEDDDDLIDAGGRERGTRRASLGNAKGSLRTVEMGYIVERLKELGEIYHESKSKQPNGRRPLPRGTQRGILEKYSSLELYTNLFTRLLYPPTRITTADFHDPYSLKVQIVALRETLAMEKLWLNFSVVGWRIRLGQILWGKNSTAEPISDEEGGEGIAPPRSDAEKVWLLLQILVACELVVRMDAIVGEANSEDSAVGSLGSRDELLDEFKTIGSKKVEWDITLARRWLENVKLVESEAVGQEEKTKTPPAPVKKGWFSSRSAEPSPPTDQSESEGDDDESASGKSYDALICPRNHARQLSGLLYFARRLQWPQIETLSATLQEKLRLPSNFSTPSQSMVVTPLDTPLSVAGGNGYFPSIARPRRVQELSSSGMSFTSSYEKGGKGSAFTKAMGSEGWLSRTYFSGLILPGEGLSHFLISTLLENDSSAVEKLGFRANLYSGFQYDGMTWWSSFSPVGKVLAGYEGSREVGGWIGPCLGSGLGEIGIIDDGWVDVVTVQLDEEPRAKRPYAIKEESNPLGKGPKGNRTVLSTDFTMPRDEIDEEERVVLEGLVFKDAAREPEEMTGEFLRFEVELHFSILPLNEKLEIKLTHDVFFVSSFHCLEPPASMNSPQNGHLLHKDFSYQSVAVDSLTEEHFKDRDGVLVIEAGGVDGGSEVLARAWCSMIGTHAVIGRKGRTCLACCVREARGLGIGVVIRIG
ncbi:hypothetical protein L873DRAFT_1675325 [Choiromyces venosus 120613-1]|uniref:Uncharacterized protein n=1 Tax=Choiromyces venosus 120613-1 TaxID=1336337 RepID=A0A3N4K064_9PEZI|nr:hypothetical protein L873DRAFT_1675325 [Choiromyces venosus 120613-1]